MHTRSHSTAYSGLHGSRNTCRSCTAGSYNWNNLSSVRPTHGQSESAFPQQHHMLNKQDAMYHQQSYYSPGRDQEESSKGYVARQQLRQTRPLIGVRRSPDSGTSGTQPSNTHQLGYSQNETSQLKQNNRYMPSITARQQDTHSKQSQQHQNVYDDNSRRGSPGLQQNQGSSAADNNSNSSPPRRTWRMSPSRSGSPAAPATKKASIWSQLRGPSPKPSRRSPSPVVERNPRKVEPQTDNNNGYRNSNSNSSSSHTNDKLEHEGSPGVMQSMPNQPQQNPFARYTRSISPGPSRQQQVMTIPRADSLAVTSPAALPAILTATDRLYLQITEPGNALTSIKELMEFKAVSHATLIKQLLTLHKDGRLTKEQLGRLYGLSDEARTSGTGLSWSQVQQAMPQTVRGKQKRYAAAMMYLEALHGQAVEAQEQTYKGLTEMQVTFVEAFLSDEAKAEKLRSASPVTDEAVQSTGVQGADMLKAMSPAAAKKVLAWLEGSSIEQVANPPVSKKPIKLLTVQTALVDALKLGVALPEHRLLKEFQLTGDNGQLSFDDVAAIIHRLQPHQQDAPALQWYNKVRSEMLAVPQIAGKLNAQEDALGASDGWSFTLQQIRLVAYLIRLHQQQLAAREQNAGFEGHDVQGDIVYSTAQQQQQAKLNNQKARPSFRPSGLGRA